MPLKKIISILLVGVVVFLGSCNDDSSIEDPIIYEYEGKKRVVGYLPYYRFINSGQIDYCKITHLNLAFANPDQNGDLNIPESINGVVDLARTTNENILVFISLAGGSLTIEQEDTWSFFIDNNDNIPILVDKIVEYVLLHNLDGVDVDLEWSHVTVGYSNFILALDKALNKEGKLITAALPNNTRFEHINDDALNAFDFINIMSYDATGPWNPNIAGQHSSYEFAVNGVDFWNKTQGIDSEKLSLGVPFYGYDFTNANINSFTYGQIVAEENEYAELDAVGQMYYNGRLTIERKVELAAQKTGGIMIWELGQDSFDEHSLLTTIHDKFTKLGIQTTGICGN